MNIRDSIRYGSRVVSKITGHTGEVIDVHDWGVRVYNAKRGYEKETWPWSIITVRFPRKIKRWPFPRRWPRKKPDEICYCKIGRMEVRDGAVWCTRCKYVIGTTSFPARIRRACDLYRKAHRRLGANLLGGHPSEIQKGVPKRRQAHSGDQAKNKKAWVGKNKVGAHPKRQNPRGSKKALQIPSNTKRKGAGVRKARPNVQRKGRTAKAAVPNKVVRKKVRGPRTPKALPRRSGGRRVASAR